MQITSHAIILKFIFMCMSVLSAFTYAYLCMSDALGGQKTELEPLELEVLMVVSCHVVLGIEPGSYGSAVSLNH